MAVIPAQTGICISVLIEIHWADGHFIELSGAFSFLAFIACSKPGRYGFPIISDAAPPYGWWSHACYSCARLWHCSPLSVYHRVHSTCMDNLLYQAGKCYIQLCWEGVKGFSLGSARTLWKLKYGNHVKAVHIPWFTVLPCTYWKQAMQFNINIYLCKLLACLYCN